MITRRIITFALQYTISRTALYGPQDNPIYGPFFRFANGGLGTLLQVSTTPFGGPILTFDSLTGSVSGPQGVLGIPSFADGGPFNELLLAPPSASFKVATCVMTPRVGSSALSLTCSVGARVKSLFYICPGTTAALGIEDMFYSCANVELLAIPLP